MDRDYEDYDSDNDWVSNEGTCDMAMEAEMKTYLMTQR